MSCASLRPNVTIKVANLIAAILVSVHLADLGVACPSHVAMFVIAAVTLNLIKRQKRFIFILAIKIKCLSLSLSQAIPYDATLPWDQMKQILQQHEEEMKQLVIDPCPPCLVPVPQ